MVSCIRGRFYITAVKLAMATAEEVTLARVPSPSLLTLCVNTTLGTSSQTLQKRTQKPNEDFFLKCNLVAFKKSLIKITKTDLQTFMNFLFPSMFPSMYHFFKISEFHLGETMESVTSPALFFYKIPESLLGTFHHHSHPMKLNGTAVQRNKLCWNQDGKYMPVKPAWFSHFILNKDEGESLKNTINLKGIPKAMGCCVLGTLQGKYPVWSMRARIDM